LQRAPTHFGRPNWDQVYQGIADQHPDTDVGVFFVRPFPPLPPDSLMGAAAEDTEADQPIARLPFCLRAVRPAGAEHPAAPHVQQVYAARQHALLLWCALVL
jgi:hypothetical protein